MATGEQQQTRVEENEDEVQVHEGLIEEAELNRDDPLAANEMPADLNGLLEYMRREKEAEERRRVQEQEAREERKEEDRRRKQEQEELHRKEDREFIMQALAQLGKDCEERNKITQSAVNKNEIKLDRHDVEIKEQGALISYLVKENEEAKRERAKEREEFFQEIAALSKRNISREGETKSVVTEAMEGTVSNKKAIEQLGGQLEKQAKRMDAVKFEIENQATGFLTQMDGLGVKMHKAIESHAGSLANQQDELKKLQRCILEDKDRHPTDKCIQKRELDLVKTDMKAELNIISDGFLKQKSIVKTLQTVKESAQNKSAIDLLSMNELEEKVDRLQRDLQAKTEKHACALGVLENETGRCQNDLLVQNGLLKELQAGRQSDKETIICIQKNAFGRILNDLEKWKEDAAGENVKFKMDLEGRHHVILSDIRRRNNAFQNDREKEVDILKQQLAKHHEEMISAMKNMLDPIKDIVYSFKGSGTY